MAYNSSGVRYNKLYTCLHVLLRQCDVWNIWDDYSVVPVLLNLFCQLLLSCILHDLHHYELAVKCMLCWSNYLRWWFYWCIQSWRRKYRFSDDIDYNVYCLLYSCMDSMLLCVSRVQRHGIWFIRNWWYWNDGDARNGWRSSALAKWGCVWRQTCTECLILETWGRWYAKLFSLVIKTCNFINYYPLVG